MVDRIDWVNGTPEDAIRDYVQWRAAVERLDAGNVDQLVSLLNGDLSLGPEARSLIADVFLRYRLTKKRGGQRRPAYSISEEEGKARLLAKLVKYHRRTSGLRLEDAVQIALRENIADRLKEEGDDRPRTDEQLDEMVSDNEREYLINRLRR